MPSKDNETANQQLRETIQEEIEEYFQEMRPLFERIAAEVSLKVFNKKFSRFRKCQIDLSSEVKTLSSNPPLPETIPGTRKHMVQRGKLSGTVDASLLKLFEEERNERGYNISRMLDVVLWTYFSITKPKKVKLSSQSSEGSHDTE